MPKWGMVIDLDKCTGCGACVAACKTENNVGVVSPRLSSENRSMFWMEMIKMVEGEEYPDMRVRYIPRPCFHCDRPPCTRVCPVRATYLAEEGLVAQIYNRCIGCRYCMAACPYTVKVFNWYEPQWSDERKQCVNPDVSLRPKGVVEKCTFCYHRLQIAREDARAENRPLKEADYRVACQDACPAAAISFGDLEDKSTKVYELSRSTRAMRIMEDIGTEPKVFYLSEGE
ncbi:MAG: 4Fe-4S dicluster domain-containing protein [Candidatus Krumholzibacteria bacterium]|nr:4Fe-4S dicluster domain-containing protein [Candidatus Krumholzibacteria bacterium]